MPARHIARRKWVLVAMVAVVLVSATWYGFRSTNEDEAELPRILVASAVGGLELHVWGEVTYDPDSNCIFLLTSDLTPHGQKMDRAIDIEWPAGSQPVVVGGVPGVRVGAESGGGGSTTVMVGDLIVGSGIRGIQGDQRPTCERSSHTPANIYEVRVVEKLDTPEDLIQR